jgi:hypothetical protein
MSGATDSSFGLPWALTNAVEVQQTPRNYKTIKQVTSHMKGEQFRDGQCQFETGIRPLQWGLKAEGPSRGLTFSGQIV